MKKELQAVDYGAFGKEVLDVIKESVGGGTGDESMYELADLAVRHELIDYVPYDEGKHGVVFLIV